MLMKGPGIEREKKKKKSKNLKEENFPSLLAQKAIRL